VTLQVRDFRDGGAQTGQVVIYEGVAAIRVGKNVYAIMRGHNDSRFRLTEESARAISEYAVRKEIADVTETTRKSYMNAWHPEAVKSGKSKEELRREVLEGVLEIISGGRLSHKTRVSGKRSGIISLTFKCGREGATLLDLAQKGGMNAGGDKGIYEFRIESVPNENEWERALKGRGYKKNKFFPARVKIEHDGTFVTFFPDDEEQKSDVKS
jgi:hypothetical protein